LVIFLLILYLIEEGGLMINLKDIYSEMMEAIENMSDEEMIDEMTKEGCIYLGKVNKFDISINYN
jgi:hypothetical protein